MSPGAHALLSASGAKRWMACPPSAVLESQFPEEASPYAEEGTRAHAYAELELRLLTGQIEMKAYRREAKKLAVDDDMAWHVNHGYLDYAQEKIAEAQRKDPAAAVFIEQRVDFSPWVQDGFGTADLVIIAGKTVSVIDLKYGKGVPVSPENNPQLSLYALGALHAFSWLYEIDTVRMTICQPRLDSITETTVDLDTLLTWAQNEVRPRADLAKAGEGEFAAGEHCRFCKARFTCRARAEAHLALAQMEFLETPELLRDEEIGEVLTKADELQHWVEDLKAYALDQAVNHGKKWIGWKLVEGRSVRKYRDEQAVQATLVAAGYKEDLIAPRAVLGITAMEKAITKKGFAAHLQDLVVRPAGKPVLAPEADKRPELSSVASAVADFAEETLGEVL